jgi:hypothetical protein
MLNTEAGSAMIAAVRATRENERGQTMKARLLKVGETRQAYLQAARRYARARYHFHRNGEHRYCHRSFAVEAALKDTERRFSDLGTFGVEGDCRENGEGHITLQYLNTGDSYAATICYWRGRFVVTSWGDIVESVLPG